MRCNRICGWVGVLGLALLCGGTEQPPLQDSVQWPEPTSRTPLRVNPPTFRWPASGAGGYMVELARGPQFREAARMQMAETFYRPLKPLESGVWHWRVRPLDGNWMAAESFEIPVDLPVWEIPDWPSLLDRIPKGHPRIYARPEDVASYRAKARSPLHDLVTDWARQRASLIGTEPKSKVDPDTEPPATGGDGNEARLRKGKIRQWAAKSGSHQLMDGVADFSWLWLLTGDEKFAAEARRRVLLATRLDPNSELSDAESDFANANVVGQAGIAYDLLYERFSAADRRAIRAMLAARIEPIMRKVERSPKRLFQAHGWQRAYLEGLMGSLAIYGEEPKAHRWVETGLKMFVSFYPWFGSFDGGSAEGSNYYSCCDMLSSLNTNDVFRAAFGLEFARDNPWYRNNPYYLMYALPPGGMRSLFGDVNPNRYYESAGPGHRLAAMRMAELYRNGYAADYAARLQEDRDPDAGFERFRWSPIDLPPRQAIERLPPARAFRDIGMVFMHSAMASPAANVRFEFRSSPYGATGHSHSDQNAFNITAFNEPLILDSGYYTSAGDRHHAGWTRRTKAHNTVLVDETGQAREEGAGPAHYGTITQFEQSADWVYTAGSAAAAYDQVKLDRFDRHVVWLRGKDVQTYVIIDDLAARGEHRFEWLLHAAREMQFDAAARRITVRNSKAQARVSMLEPAAITFHQTDRFDPPPENWRPDRKTDYQNQWHAHVEAKAADSMRFVAVVQVGRQGFQADKVEPVEAGACVAGWKVRLEGRRVNIGRAQ